MSIEVITGPMFAGKSAELLRRCRAAEWEGLEVLICKSDIDNRYSSDCVVTHDGDSEKCLTVGCVSDIALNIQGVQVLGIDEAQFFDDSLACYLKRLSNEGIRILVAGLDMDYRQEPFKSIADIMAIADKVDKLPAVCSQCGKKAMYSMRLTDEKQTVLVGAEQYEARCAQCLHKGRKSKRR